MRKLCLRALICLRASTSVMPVMGEFVIRAQLERSAVAPLKALMRLLALPKASG